MKSRASELWLVMFHIGKDIPSLTDFKRCTGDLVAQLYESNAPSVVVQDAEAHEHILDRLEELESGRTVRGRF